MKTTVLLLSLFLLSGCYTQLRITDFTSVNSNSNREYSQDSSYSDDENVAYNDGFDDGYDHAAQVFTDWRVASRWSPYYNRFYWVDPYWAGNLYDPFLWDPYWGFYGAWGVSYYATGFSYWGGHSYNYWGWPNQYYWGNVAFIRDGTTNGNARWSYGPRNFGDNGSTSVRGSRNAILKTNPVMQELPRGSRVNVRGSRSGSGSGVSIPPKRPSTGSSSSSGSSSGGRTTRPSSSGSSGNSGSSRPSRSGDNQSYVPTPRTSSSTAVSYAKPRTTNNSVKSSTNTKKSETSSKPATRSSRSGN